MERFLQKRVQPELAVSRRIRCHRNHHHQILPQPYWFVFFSILTRSMILKLWFTNCMIFIIYRGRQEKLGICSTTQKVRFKIPNFCNPNPTFQFFFLIVSVFVNHLNFSDPLLDSHSKLLIKIIDSYLKSIWAF